VNTKYVYRVPTLAWELFDSVRGYQKQDLYKNE
jgi:hypothetical protein